jgi:dihydrofolate reductase
VATLIYTALASLDGYVADAAGSFDWAFPDEQVHGFVNDLERDTGTHLYGRRMYEVMAFWETAHEEGDLPAVARDYATIWQGADKVVYSTTLDAVTTARTRLERHFDPSAVAALLAGSAHDVGIAGPTLAGEALRAGLVDECRLVVFPVAVGGGLPALPRGERLDLELADERRFAGGAVYLRYRVSRAPGR